MRLIVSIFSFLFGIIKNYVNLRQGGAQGTNEGSPNKDKVPEPGAEGALINRGSLNQELKVSAQNLEVG